MELLKYALNFSKDGYSVAKCDKTVNGALEIPSMYEELPVTDIDSYAFADCESLKSVTICEGAKGIPWDAFSNCPNLEQVTVRKPDDTEKVYAVSDKEIVKRFFKEPSCVPIRLKNVPSMAKGIAKNK